MLRNLRQHALVNNEIAERCFYSCVGGLTERKMNSNEDDCVENCAAKLITATTRMVFKIAENNPMGMGPQAIESQKFKTQ